MRSSSQHGNPTSSYLWRNVMPHLEDWAASSPATSSAWGRRASFPTRPRRYHFAEQQPPFALWDALDLGDNVVLVLHDWGSALGFHWSQSAPATASRHRLHGGIVKPITWDEFPRRVRAGLRRVPLPAGEEMVLERQHVRRGSAAGAIMRTLTDEEMDHYRAPFARPGEGRRPTPRGLATSPIDGGRADVTAIVRDYGAWLETSTVPKLVNAEPGSLMRGAVRDSRADLPNLTEVTVPGTHFIQEDRPHEIGTAIAQFVQELRR